MNRRTFAKSLVVAAQAGSGPLLMAQESQPRKPQSYDLVVYGGTAAGITTAIAAARQGLRVALLEPLDHIGGMVTGGLSSTDVGKREVIGGMALEFYLRVGRRYGLVPYGYPVGWRPEPSVAISVFAEMLDGTGAKVFYRHRLKERGGVSISAGKVRAIEMENGARFEAPIFADCTYEGDLIAQAKISYTWGREGVKEYGESLAGVRGETPHHQFLYPIKARDAQGRLYPEISPDPMGNPGDGDKKAQAYNFRVIATTNPSLRLPWPKPERYDPERYLLLALYLEGEVKRLGRSPLFNDLAGIGQIPNQKADLNNKGGFSSDYIGKNYDYPDGDYATRARIWQDHLEYHQGLYYFLAHDDRVPKVLQEDVNRWGPCRDEFEDTNFWPPQLYVREARRMIGEFVVTQKDLQTELTKPDAIAMGSYNSDSHNIQRIENKQGFVENEGDVQVGVKPYQIPYRVMLPKRQECTNVLAPVPFSATHIAFASLRMEPQWMMIGHAAGVAASLALKAQKPVQEIDVRALQDILLKQGAVFDYVAPAQNAAITLLSRTI